MPAGPTPGRIDDRGSGATASPILPSAAVFPVRASPRRDHRQHQAAFVACPEVQRVAATEDRGLPGVRPELRDRMTPTPFDNDL
jgi:hypothetical protein